MALLFKNYSLVEDTHLLIRFNTTKFFPRKSNTDENGVNKQNTHRHVKHSEKDNIEKG